MYELYLSGIFPLYIFRSPLPLGDRDRSLHKARAGAELKWLEGHWEKKRCTERQVNPALPHTTQQLGQDYNTDLPVQRLIHSFMSTRDQLRTSQTSRKSTHRQEAGGNLFLDPLVRSLKIIYEEKTRREWSRTKVVGLTKSDKMTLTLHACPPLA